MSVHAWEALKKKAEELTPDEQRSLAYYLLNISSTPSERRPDINDLRGTVKLSIDPLEYQNSSRADRD